MSNREGGTKVLQHTEPILTSNRYDVLSNLPEHVPSVSPPCNIRRQDLSTSSATKLRTMSQLYTTKHPTHLNRDFKHYQIPIIINGHANPPLLRRDRMSSNCDGALNVPKPSGKCDVKKNVRKK
jgi:hypothetical protein